MRWRRFARIAFLVAVESVESREESLFIGEAEAVVDSHFRLNMMHRLAVATIQEAVCRSNTGGVVGREEPSMTSGTPSPKASTPSHQRNAKTISLLPDMTASDGKAL